MEIQEPLHISGEIVQGYSLSKERCCTTKWPKEPASGYESQKDSHRKVHKENRNEHIHLWGQEVASVSINGQKMNLMHTMEC